MKKIIALSITALAVANVCAAETYNVEAGLQYGSFSDDNSTTQKMTAVGGTYYLNPIVIDHAQPFAELDFLQKASGVTVRYGNINYEDSTFASTTINPLEVSGNFYVDNFAFGATNSTWGSTNFTTKANTARYVGIKSNTTGFNVGYFVLPTTLVSFVNTADKATYSPSAGIAAIADLKTTTNGVQSHTVTSLGGTESLVFDFAYSQIKTEQTTSQNNNEYGFKVRYYPQTKYYVEGGYKVNSGDYAKDKGNTYVLGAGYEITPRFGLVLTTAKFSVSDATQKTGSTNTMLTAGYRF